MLNPNIYLQKPGCRSSGRRTACIDQLPGKGSPSLFTDQDDLSMHQLINLCGVKIPLANIGKCLFLHSLRSMQAVTLPGGAVLTHRKPPQLALYNQKDKKANTTHYITTNVMSAIKIWTTDICK